MFRLSLVNAVRGLYLYPRRTAFPVSSSPVSLVSRNSRYCASFFYFFPAERESALCLLSPPALFWAISIASSRFTQHRVGIYLLFFENSFSLPASQTKQPTLQGVRPGYNRHATHARPFDLIILDRFRPRARNCEQCASHYRSSANVLEL